MAIVPIHKAITKRVLRDFGFVPAAVDIAVNANAAVDKKQGDDAAQTNLHAMRGFFFAPDPAFGKLRVTVAPKQPTGLLSMRKAGNGIPLGRVARPSPTIKLGRLELAPDPFTAAMSLNYRLQTHFEAKDAVNRILKLARADIVRIILLQQYTTALTRLGQALHTVQDRDFHHFEPCLFKDIPDSLRRSPSYLMCRALRDTGYISKIAVDENQLALGLASRASPEVYRGAELFAPIGEQRGMLQGFRRYGGLLSLTWDAAPGGLRRPVSAPSTDQVGADAMLRSCLASEGVADDAQATADSEAFVQEIQREVQARHIAEGWDNFVHLKVTNVKPRN